MQLAPPRLINAICTPMNEDESLHREGLEAHLNAQWNHGVSGLLVGGTMGLMQLLRDETYRELIEQSVAVSKGRGEILVGIGDTSYARTRDRMQIAERSRIDGVVVLTPYFIKYTRRDLIDYFKALADESKTPLFIYYLPVLTGVPMDLEMGVELSKHPNIAGIKCSCDYAWALQLRDATDPAFRVIVAQPHLLATLAKAGVREHLDGIFAVAPGLTHAILNACTQGDWEKANEHQALLSRLLQVITSAYPLFPACEAILNAQGVPGRCYPAPIRPLPPEEKAKLLAEPVIRDVLSFHKP